MIGEIRGKGLMIGIELVLDKEKTPANTEGNKIRDFCCEKGLLLGLGVLEMC
jgi:4-aminobutyrate aminotransferase-like enzyme